MAGFDNEVMFSPGVRLQPSSAQDITLMQDGTTTNISRVNYTGDPNTVVSANPGSISHDPVSGFLWLKVSGTGTTGWERITSASTNGVLTLTGNSGGAISPDGVGNINTVGTGSLTTVGAGNTLTAQLTGLTDHAVLVGAGTATITKVGPTATAGQVLQSAGVAADPAFSTATYPSTTTINQILYSSAANVVSGLTSTIRSVLTATSSGVPIWRQVGDGQIIIGSSSSNPIAANLTAGLGISITNGTNSITIAGTGGGFPWLDNSGSFTAAANTGYFLTAASTPTLPVAPAQGTVIEFAVVATATMTITAGTGGFIVLDGATSISGGTAVSGTIGNTIRLVYRTVGTTWWATSAVGASWTIT